MHGQSHKRGVASGRSIVKKHLLQSGVRFEESFRIFPLKSNDGLIFDYIPDFYLKDIRHKNKRILIEVHTKLTLNDVIKFRLFMDTYGRAYHLIMIVHDQQLREWNRYDYGEQALFHDIWTIDAIEFFVKQLQSLTKE